MSRKDTPTPVAVFSDPGNQILIGGQTVTIKPVPLGRVRLFKDTWNGLVARFTTIVSNEDPATADSVDQLTALLIDDVIDLLAVLVPGLDKEQALDPDTGATVPEIADAFNMVLDVNRLGFLRGALPFVWSHVQETTRRLRVLKMTEAFDRLQTAMEGAQQASAGIEAPADLEEAVS